MLKPWKGRTEYKGKPGEYNQGHFALVHDFDIVEEEQIIDLTKDTRHVLKGGKTLISRNDGSQFMSDQIFETNSGEESVIGYDPENGNWKYLPNNVPNLPPNLRDSVNKK